MEKQILELLLNLKSEFTEMKSDMTSMKSDMTSMKSEITEIKSEMSNMKTDMADFKNEMHDRFDHVDAKLEGVGHQFELTNEARINDIAFLNEKVTRIEKDVYILKNKN
ncbi:MAG: hypothetical protein LRY71_15305 [Bacillaceae bacterium]|nr:hypothetical protein [Bacillaceae bacterium]